MSLPRLVTTSWDDGDRADLRIAEMLQARQVKGTFYIPIDRPAEPSRLRPALSDPQVRSLADKGFEVGAHSVSHRPLRGMPQKELPHEVGPCKTILEDIVGKEVRMFCYPLGRYDPNVVNELRQAGYRGARTVRMLATGLRFDPFEMPTSVQAFAHAESSYLRNVARARKAEGLKVYWSQRRNLKNWVDLATSLFDSVMQEGGVWHLYGHSWEVDQLGQWEDLEKVLDYVSGRAGVIYISNSELLDFLPKGVREN